MAEFATVLARIRLLSAAEGGRLGCAASGYRPATRFGEEEYASGAIELIDREQLNPGEECDARIHYFSGDFVRPFLQSGRSFDMCEGARKIGEMTILEVLT